MPDAILHDETVEQWPLLRYTVRKRQEATLLTAPLRKIPSRTFHVSLCSSHGIVVGIEMDPEYASNSFDPLYPATANL
jgi:hypothetical protein